VVLISCDATVIATDQRSDKSDADTDRKTTAAL